MTCPECKAELERGETTSAFPFIVGSRRSYPRYECPECGYERDEFYKTTDVAHDRFVDGD